MGENEQGGMLRTVVVVGLVAIIAAVVVFGVISMKAPLRNNTVLARDAGHNLVQLENNSMKSKFIGFRGKTLVTDHDDGSGTLTFTLKANEPNVYGVCFNDHVGYNANQELKNGDKWHAEADIKTDSPNAVNWFYDGSHKTGMGVEASDAKWISNPAFSTTWQHYVVEGAKGTGWGPDTFVLFFTSSSAQPVNVDVKNIELYRIP